MLGKTVASVTTDGNILMIQATDGHVFNIKWIDDQNESVPGIPVLEGIGVNIVLPG